MAKYIYRSAKTGKIVTEKFALKNPDTTVRETIKPKEKRTKLIGGFKQSVKKSKY
jgi:hypothetical protein